MNKSLPTYSFLAGKASEKDKAMLNKLKGISIEPIADFYELMQYNDDFLEIFSILSERTGDVEKTIKGEILENKYRYHQINFSYLNDEDSDELADFILYNLNNQTYYKKRKNTELANLILRREQS